MNNVASAISKLPWGVSCSIKIVGEMNTDILSDIKTAIKNNSNSRFSLDLSQTTGLSEIPDSAFSNCQHSLTSVIIPNGVTSIGDSAFYWSSSLTSIIFEDTSTWYYTSKDDYTGGTVIDVTDPTQNATYLKSTYDDKYWYKK